MINAAQSNSRKARNSRNKQTNTKIKQTMQLTLKENMKIHDMYVWMCYIWAEKPFANV